MSRETERYRHLSRRAFVLGGLQFGVWGVLLARMAHLQLFKGNEYRALSQHNRVKLQLVAPPRGMILDRMGKVLAANRLSYRAVMDTAWMERESAMQSLEALQKLIDIEPEIVQHIRQKTRFGTASPPLVLKEPLDWEEVAKIELHIAALNGISVESFSLRDYPYGVSSAHLLGYVGSADASELEEEEEDQSRLLRLADMKIGKNGVEKMLDDNLRGTPGMRQLEVNAHGAVLQEISNQPAIAAPAQRITIDARLQELTAQRLGAESASAVVMDVANGQILALASMPAYNPNEFSGGIAHKTWKELTENPKNPLLNKAISGLYPPGSTFKMMTGLAGLESGALREKETVFCPGYFTMGNTTFRCWKEGGHGHVDIRGAIAQSCDTFFYTLGRKLGIAPIAAMARRFGLGSSTEIELVGEKEGTIPDAEWKATKLNQPWQDGDTINSSIGQGYVLATPLQLCVMSAGLATNRLIMPTLLAQEPGQISEIAVNPAHLRVVQEGMAQVVNQPFGTAYASRIQGEEKNPPQMAGKTGTSQVRKLITRGVNQATIPWEQRHHALFVAYAPVVNPRYAMCVVVEHGGGGAAAAAPIARDVLAKALEWNV